MRGTHEVRAGTPLQRHGRAQLGCLTQAALPSHRLPLPLLALCLSLHGCKTGQVSFYATQVYIKAGIWKQKTLVLLLFSWITWTQLHKQV